jgi:hypothetical protein
MNQKNDRRSIEQTPPAELPRTSAPRKRFRIEKIEERIAPTKGGNSHGGHQSGASGSFTGSFSSY